MSIKQTSTDSDTAELEELRKYWYRKVYDTLEKVDERVDTLANELHVVKNDLKADIVKCKSDLQDEIKNFEKDSLVEFGTRLDLSLEAINVRLETLEDPEVRNELKRAIEGVQKEIACAKLTVSNNKDTLKDDISNIKERLATIETKVWVLAAGVGTVVSIITTIAVTIIKSYF